MVKNLVPYFICILLFASCDLKPERKKVDQENASEKPALDVSLKKTDKTLIKSERIITSRNVINFPEPRLNNYLNNSFKVLPLPKEKVLIPYGTDNLKNVTKVKLGEPEKKSIKPKISEALPFVNIISEKLSYKTLGVSQGLASSSISSIFQDSRGYFWFGSKRGVTRFNGYSYHYFALANDGERKTVTAIAEDKEGNIWMSFSSLGGLVKYDGSFFYEYNEGKGYDIGEKYLGIIMTDSKGDIWLKSESNIIKFNGDEFTIYPYGFQDLKGMNVIVKENNNNGNYWISGIGGVCLLEDDRMFYVPLEAELNKSQCHPIIEDDRGLIASTGKSITILKDDSLRVYTSSFFSGNQIRNTMVLGDDFLLFSEQKRTGFCSISGESLNIVSEFSPIHAGNYPYLVDNKNNVWFGKPGEGVLVYNPNDFKHFKFESLRKGGQVSAIFPDSRGDIWMGTHGFGLYRYNGSEHEGINLTESINDAVIRAIHEDHAGNIWVGTDGIGLYKITPQKDTFNLYKVEKYALETEKEFSIFSITEDKQNNIWIGTKDEGVFIIQGDDISNYQYLNSANENMSDIVRDLLVDSEGNIWIANQRNGLQCYREGQFQYFNGESNLSSNQVVSLHEDHLSKIWVGTMDKGVDCFSDDKFVNFSTDEGLSSNTVWTISEDHFGNMWLGADDCLNVLLRNKEDEDISKENLKIKTYCNLGGLEGAEFYANTGVVDKQNAMWWGTDQMALRLSNADELVEQRDVKLILENVYVANNNIDFVQLKDSILLGKDWWVGPDKDLNLAEVQFDYIESYTNTPNNLRLPHELNDLKFVYSAVASNISNELQFSYMLEGLDKDWSPATPENKIDYRNIPAGSYLMKVRVSEVKGIWTVYHEYPFYIAPVWYKTWWAKTLWVLLTAALLVVIYTIYNRRRQTNELIQRQKEVSRLKSQLYANITHEFRTPLTMIMGINNQIKSHEKETEIIRRNSEKLLQHINQLLDASKLESGNLEVQYAQSDVIPYLKFISESFELIARQNSIKFTFYSEEKSLIMDYDKVKLQHIVYNLLSNAIKFTQNNGKVIFHVSKDVVGKKDVLKLKITDDGIGIPLSEQSRIFERFYQVKENEGNKVVGTGIGLSLTKDLVEMLNGSINLKSGEGSGAEFSVVLPISNVAPLTETFSSGQAEDFKNVPSEYLIEDLAHGGKGEDGKKLLVVEDNVEIAAYLKTIFKSSFDVIIAGNGIEGLSKANSEIPDVIISDVNMPEMDGFEMVQKLRSNISTSHIPIILLTAKTTQVDKVEGLKRGADAYLIKPFDEVEVRLRVENLIKGRLRLQQYYSTKINEGFSIEQLVEEEEETVQVENGFILKLRELIQVNISNSEFGVQQLADEMNLSQMQVYRKLKALTGQTSSQFIRSYRLNVAKEMLKNQDLSISEIAYEVGFSDPNYFSRTFHKEFGGPPGDFRN